MNEYSPIPRRLKALSAVASIVSSLLVLGVVLMLFDLEPPAAPPALMASPTSPLSERCAAGEGGTPCPQP